uniref:Uncharacterized protein n=1 Tax=Meloidogyne hapla TaxID=6305 RepID=A0A1I8B9W2_MELHA
MRNFTFILLFNLLRLYSLLCMEKAEGSSGGGINYYTNHENVLIFALKNLHRECQENKVMQSGILKRIEENYIYMMRHQSKG